MINDNRDDLKSTNRNDRAGMTGYVVPLGIAAIAIVAAMLLYNLGSDRTTVSSTSPTTTQTTPMAPTTTPTPTVSSPRTGG